MTRRCSHCGHNGHNSRTCTERGVKIFGVRLSDSSRMRKSVSTGNLSNYSGPSQIHQTPDLSDNGNVYQEGYISDGQNLANQRERKKGVPWTEEEHRQFLLGLQKLGKGDWRGISRNFVQTRTPTQVASHAQKYFIRQNNLNKRKRRSSLFDIGTEGHVSGVMNRSMSTPSLATLTEDGHCHQSPNPVGGNSPYLPFKPYTVDGSSQYHSNMVPKSTPGFHSSTDIPKSHPYMLSLPHVGSSSSLESLSEKVPGSQAMEYHNSSLYGSRLSIGSGLSGLNLGRTCGGELTPTVPTVLGVGWSEDGMIRVPSTHSLKLDDRLADQMGKRNEEGWHLGNRPLVTRRFLSDGPLAEQEGDVSALPVVREEGEKKLLDGSGSGNGPSTTGRDLQDLAAMGLTSGKPSSAGDPSVIRHMDSLRLNQENASGMNASAGLAGVQGFFGTQHPYGTHSHHTPPGYHHYSTSSYHPSYGSLPAYPWSPYGSGPLSATVAMFGVHNLSATHASNPSTTNHVASPKLYRPTATLPSFVASRKERDPVSAIQETAKEYTDESKGIRPTDSAIPGAVRPSPLTLQLLESPSLRQSAFQSRTTAQPNGNVSPRSSDVGHSTISVV